MNNSFYLLTSDNFNLSSWIILFKRWNNVYLWTTDRVVMINEWSTFATSCTMQRLHYFGMSFTYRAIGCAFYMFDKILVAISACFPFLKCNPKIKDAYILYWLVEILCLMATLPFLSILSYFPFSFLVEWKSRKKSRV